MKQWKSRIKYILLFTIVILFPFIAEKGYILFYEKLHHSLEFSWMRFSVFFLVGAFLSLHFIVSYKKIWDFIFHKRYIIGILIFIAMVFNGIHGSSLYVYDSFIEPNFKVENSDPVFGVVRPIRSDEFLVDTPAILNQARSDSDFSITNDAIMGRENTTVLMFPQLPTKSISVLSNPKMIGFLFLSEDMGYSWFWFIMMFICFFASFEVCMLITKGKRLYALLGACLLTLSPAFLWWGQYTIFASGFCAILFFNKFLESKRKWPKFLWAIGIGYAGTVYIMSLYPAWLITFGYMFMGFTIWQLIVHKETIKWKDLLYLIPIILTMVAILAPAFLGSAKAIELATNTVYPGDRVSYGGYGSNLLYNYFIAPLYTIKDIGNPCEASQFIGLYPLPFIYSIYIIFKGLKDKSKKVDWFLLIFTLIGIIMVLWNYVELPFLSKLTLLTMSTPDRAQITVNAICILLIVRIISKYEIDTKFSMKKIALCMTLSIGFFIYGINVNRIAYGFYMYNSVIFGSAVLFIPVFTLFFANFKRGNQVLATLLIGTSLFLFATVQPFSTSVKVMHEKPLAKEVQKIVKMDKDAVWVAVNQKNAGIHMPGYILSNGARILNSTNYYPNFDLWSKLDNTGKFEDIYNRYAHISINITEDKTSFNLSSNDLMQVKINKNDVTKLNAKYFVTEQDLTEFNTNTIKYDKVYKQDNVYIFELKKSK